jgi:hypothetical protein
MSTPLVRIAQDLFAVRDDATIVLKKHEDGTWVICRDGETTSRHETKREAATSIANSLLDRSVTG